MRDRAEDIPSLTEIFLTEAAASNREKRKAITSGAMDILTSYTWPGNVRELKNLVERLAIMVQNDAITVKDLPCQSVRSKKSWG